MSSSDTVSQKALHGKSARTHGLETTTRSVKRLVARQAVLADQPREGVSDSTDTLSVMLRVGEPPTVLLMMDDPAARKRIAATLAEMPLVLLQGVASNQTLQVPPGTTAILLTDHPDLVRSVRALRTEPRIHILFLAPDENANLADAMLAGADDCIGQNASREALRARFIVAHRHSRIEASFRAVLRENRRLSTTDELTKVANRRFFAQHFPLEVERAARYKHSLSFITCDIDHFKKVNDTYGHLIGDEVLREFGTRLQHPLRQGTDWVARVGGEEFAIVLPETQLAAAMSVAEKLRARIRAHRFRVQGRKIPISASFGVCGVTTIPTRERGFALRMQESADAALYRSKREGRNRVTAANAVGTPSPTVHATR